MLNILPWYLGKEEKTSNWSDDYENEQDDNEALIHKQKDPENDEISKEQPAFLKEYFWGFMPKCCCRGNNQLTVIEFKRYESFVNQADNYDEKNAKHENKLKKLWIVAFPDKQVPSNMKSKDWQTIGFQGNNARTDFRGGGIISLKCILYFFINYSNNKNEILEKNEELFYLSVSAINLWFELLKLLKFKILKEQKHLHNYECTNTQFKNFMKWFAQNKKAFYEFHSHLLILLETYWQIEKVKSSSNPLYVFNNALDQTMKASIQILDEFPSDVSQIGVMVNNLCSINI